MIRLAFFFVFLFPFSAFSICEDPVKDTYIVQTNQPEKFLSQKQNFKTSSLNFIYRQPSLNFLNKLSSNEKKPLSISTLTVQLGTEQVKNLKEKNYILSVEQDCYVSPNSLASHRTTEAKDSNSFANDSLYGEQWGIPLTKANTLIQTPLNHTSIIAVSDSGFKYQHPDFFNNVWLNKSEYEGKSGVDDDGNGCVDDIVGCDVTNNTGDVGVNLYASNLIDHGSHVAGIIGALQNNHLGIYGLAQKSQIMLVKGFSSTRKTSVSDLLKSIYYAVDQGAEFINCSWSVPSKPLAAEFSAFEYARINNVLAVVAAGNDSIFASKTSPGGLTNVLSVGSINTDKDISTFSNFGNSVDIYAPGGDGSARNNEYIYSLASDDLYVGKRGTSMSAPFVIGILANIKSAFPQASRNELLNLLFQSAEEKTSYAFYEKNYSETIRVIDVQSLYKKAEVYFLENEPSLDYEPKEIRKPASSKPSSSNSIAGLEGVSSGCSNNLSQPLAKAHLPYISCILAVLPLLLLLKIRRKANSKK